jgi:putative ABC transport system permease protein
MAGWHVPLRWAYTMRDIARRPLRWLLTLTGIVLGVASATAVFSAVEATRDGYAGMFRLVTGRATHEIAPAVGREAFAPDLDAIRSSPGVRSAAGVVQVQTALITPAGPVPLLILAVDPEHDGPFRDFSPPLPWGPTGIRLEKRFAARHGIEAFDEVTISTPNGPGKLTVTELQDAVGPMAFNGGAAGVVSLPLARELFQSPWQTSALPILLPVAVAVPMPAPAGAVGVSALSLEQALPAASAYTAVHVILEPGASPPSVPGAVTRPAGKQAGLAVDFLAAVEQLQVTLCVIAVVAGGLVIVNTVLMHLAERRRQLALLRALGATRWQVTSLVLQQSLMVGLIGTLIGVPLGVVLAALLLAINAGYLGVPLPSWPIMPHVLIMAALLGPVLSVVAAFFPARAAAARPPLDDLAGRPTPDTSARWPIYLGVLLLAGVALYIVSLLVGWLGGNLGTLLQPVAAGSFLVGSACLIPPLLPLLLAPVAWMFQYGGVEARLALRLVSRHPQRTGLTVGVLFAALTASISFGTSFDNNMADIRLWVREKVPDEWLVRATPPDPATILTMAPLPDGLDTQLAGLPSVGVVRRLRFLSLELGGSEAMLIAREAPPGQFPFAQAEGEAASAYRRGEALVGTPLARRLGLKVGDSIDLPTPDGPRSVRVAGLVKEYAVGGMALYLDYTHAQELFGFTGPQVVGLDPEPGREEELQTALSAISGKWGVMAETNEHFAENIVRMGHSIRMLMMGLVILVTAVAGVGVMNTLAANLLDQSRQFALLRALGMRRGQLYQLVLAQAVALALAGVLAGLPNGILLAWLMNITTPALLGHIVPFGVGPGYIALCVAGTFVVVLLAAWWPANRAASLDIASAVRHT